MDNNLKASSSPTKLNPCCNIESNLVIQDSGKKDLELKVCSQCGARHFELTVDPGDFTMVSPEPMPLISFESDTPTK